jgi:cytochrome c peroxidase
MNIVKFGLLVAIGSSLFLLGCSGKHKKMNEADKLLWTEATSVFQPIPEQVIDREANSQLIHLGEKLYFEKKLSINDTISCNSCHQLDKFGVDNEKTSPGHNKKRGGRNSPTVYNSALNFVQFWDGRAKDMEEQAIGPILNPIEHGLPNEKAALKKIDTTEYRELFKVAFTGQAEGFTFKNIGIAIGAFEKTLLTPSRFDDFLKGDGEALTVDEKKGLKKFVEFGCTSCHDGAGIGGGSFQKLGLINDFKTKDQGRFEVTKNPEDKQMFKVPSLRNVVHTGPYFHDGRVATLDKAIKLMGFHQLGIDLDDEDVKDIKAFLGSLSGKEGTFYTAKTSTPTAN